MDSLIPKYVEPLSFSDERGHLDVLIERHGIVFKNSASKAGVFRGLHIQMPPHKQEKYIRVKKGLILDVCLDLNPASPQFGSLSFFDLQATEKFFYIPPHCAHGFFCKTDVTFEYICFGSYDESSEVAIFPPVSVAKRVGLEVWSGCSFSEKDLKGVSVSESLEMFRQSRWDL